MCNLAERGSADVKFHVNTLLKLSQGEDCLRYPRQYIRGLRVRNATDLHLFQFLQNVLERVTLNLIASRLAMSYLRT